MAGIMERIRLIARSEVADLRERFEDPEQEINQTIADAMVSYASLKKEASSVFDGEQQARSQVEGLQGQAQRWHNVARKALLAGNEGDARTALSREQDLKERLKTYQGLYDQAHEVAETYRRRMAEIEDGISQLQAKMARIKAKEATVRATETAASMAGGSSVLNQRETEADWDLAQAEGLAEAQRVSLESSIDDALAELRRQMETEERD